MRSVCYQKHRLIGRLEDRAESERKIAIPALGKRDRMPARMESHMTEPAPETIELETTKLGSQRRYAVHLIAIRDAAVIFPP